LTRLIHTGEERYGLALVLILASMIFIMASSDGRWEVLIALNLQALALFASLRAAHPSQRVWAPVVLLFVAIVLAAWVQTALSTSVSGNYVRVATFALVLIATPVIGFGLVRQVKERRSITLHTMMGVLCIYLLMCLAFAAACGAIAAIGGDPFFEQGDSAGTTNNYLYYSLTTVTTVGMGDFTPATNLGRSLTAAEALIGQIYVVTVVAAIVSNLRPRKSDG